MPWPIAAFASLYWSNRTRLGGRGASESHGKYVLNLGPHALYRGGPAFRTLRAWRIPFTGHTPDVSTHAWLSYGGRHFPFFTGTPGLLASSLFGVLEKIDAARILTLLLYGRVLPSESMAHWIDRHTRSPRVRDFAAALTRVSTYTADLQHLSARAALQQIRMAVRQGVLYLD